MLAEQLRRLFRMATAAEWDGTRLSIRAPGFRGAEGEDWTRVLLDAGKGAVLVVGSGGETHRYDLGAGIGLVAEVLPDEDVIRVRVPGVPDLGLEALVVHSLPGFAGAVAPGAPAASGWGDPPRLEAEAGRSEASGFLDPSPLEEAGTALPDSPAVWSDLDLEADVLAIETRPVGTLLLASGEAPLPTPVLEMAARLAGLGMPAHLVRWAAPLLEAWLEALGELSRLGGPPPPPGRIEAFDRARRRAASTVAWFDAIARHGSTPGLPDPAPVAPPAVPPPPATSPPPPPSPTDPPPPTDPAATPPDPVATLDTARAAAASQAIATQDQEVQASLAAVGAAAAGVESARSTWSGAESEALAAAGAEPPPEALERRDRAASVSGRVAAAAGRASQVAAHQAAMNLASMAAEIDGIQGDLGSLQ